MIKKLPREVWKTLSFKGDKQKRNKYALSSLGRIASYKEDIFKDGILLKGSLSTGYQSLNLRRMGENGAIYVHREIAKLFLNKPSSKEIYVIHKNYDKLDNAAKNLKWASQEEMMSHQQNSPANVAYHERQASKTTGQKLTAAQVRTIKMQLKNQNRKQTIKQIAEKYGVAEITINRIKRGENWGRI
jgi:hypothetical protein